MKVVYQYKRTLIICTSVVLTLILFSKCINDQSNKQQPETASKQIIDTITFSQFAGSQVCANCHKEITADYFNSLHFFTSQDASAQTIKGSFY